MTKITAIHVPYLHKFKLQTALHFFCSRKYWAVITSWDFWKEQPPFPSSPYLHMKENHFFNCTTFSHHHHVDLHTDDRWAKPVNPGRVLLYSNQSLCAKLHPSHMLDVPSMEKKKNSLEVINWWDGSKEDKALVFKTLIPEMSPATPK